MTKQAATLDEAIVVSEKLSLLDRLRLIGILSDELRSELMQDAEPVDMLSLAGLGAEVWQAIEGLGASLSTPCRLCVAASRTGSQPGGARSAGFRRGRSLRRRPMSVPLTGVQPGRRGRDRPRDRRWRSPPGLCSTTRTVLPLSRSRSSSFIRCSSSGCSRKFWGTHIKSPASNAGRALSF